MLPLLLYRSYELPPSFFLSIPSYLCFSLFFWRFQMRIWCPSRIVWFFISLTFITSSIIYATSSESSIVLCATGAATGGSDRSWAVLVVAGGVEFTRMKSYEKACEFSRKQAGNIDTSVLLLSLLLSPLISYLILASPLCIQLISSPHPPVPYYSVGI